ncbi:MAG: 30S ribosomal protein S8 [Verrucomicrobiae bacterium]|nr:30S ribosomal protein S8 [Verrucomicrobiae bacterium]
MSTTDPIAEFLTCLRNANQALKPEVAVPYSRLKVEMAKLLKREGYIADYYKEEKDGKAVLRVQLKIVGKERAITGIRRISRPGRRKYVKADEIPPVLGGLGISILTTSRGLMTGHEARKARVGGELLAYVW